MCEEQRLKGNYEINHVCDQFLSSTQVIEDHPFIDEITALSLKLISNDIMKCITDQYNDIKNGSVNLLKEISNGSLLLLR